MGQNPAACTSATTLALAPILAFPADDLPSNGPWSEPVTLDRGAVASPTVAVDDARPRCGRLAAAGRARSARSCRAPGVVTVARSATQRLLTPEVATTTRGAVVAWTRAGRVEARRVGAGPAGCRSGLPAVAPGRDAFAPTFVGGTGGDRARLAARRRRARAAARPAAPRRHVRRDAALRRSRACRPRLGDDARRRPARRVHAPARQRRPARADGRRAAAAAPRASSRSRGMREPVAPARRPSRGSRSRARPHRSSRGPRATA